MAHQRSIWLWYNFSNLTIFSKSKCDTFLRHSKTPLPIYIGLSVYARTRMTNLIQLLFENGLSVSYDRVLEITAEIGDAAVSKYTRGGVVCPPEQRKGLFTTSAMDNIDHNPSVSSYNINNIIPWYKYIPFPPSN